MKLLPIMLLALPFMAQADIFKVVDANGNITYTNTQVKGAQRVIVDETPGGSVNPSPRRASAGGTPVATPASFPKVETETQKRRDATRFQILTEELNDENRMLDDARKQLTTIASQKASPDQLASAQNKVTLHEKNIEALKKELAGVKQY